MSESTIKPSNDKPSKVEINSDNYDTNIENSEKLYNRIIELSYETGVKDTSGLYLEVGKYQVQQSTQDYIPTGDFCSIELKDGKKSYKSEVIDILNGYRWTIQQFNSSKTNTRHSYILNDEGLEEEDQKLAWDIVNGVNDRLLQQNKNSVSVKLEDIYSIEDRGYKSSDIPVCYVTQWRQTISSNIMNFLNTMTAAVTSLNNTIDTIYNGSDKNLLNNASKVYSNLKNSLSMASEEQEQDDGSWLGDITKTALTSLGKFSEYGVKKIAESLDFGNPAFNSSMLAPYRLLYAMKATGKKYCFPMVANPHNNTLQNMFVDADEGGSFLTNNGPLNLLTSLSGTITNTARDAVEMIKLIGGKLGSGGYIGSAVEKAKFYQFPMHTDEYKVTFPLLNTVNAGDWKKNYRFILLFMLRNMLFRKDNASYYPPLFYDLIIPGTIRHPFCYVSRVDVRPVGMVRMLGYDQALLDLDISGSTTKTNVGNNKAIPVPEAWIVTITFNSLLTTSANMVLSGLYDLQITTQ